MVNIMKKITLLASFIFITTKSYATLDIDLDLKIPESIYPLNNEVLFIDSIQNSYSINAQRQAIKSELHLFDSAKYYYMPSATITQQVQQKFDRPGTTAAITEYTMSMSAKMTLWSNTSSDVKDAAFYSLLAATESFNEQVSSIYSLISTNLMKIEISREFIKKSKEYRKRMSTLLSSMESSAKSGLLKKSDRIFADVTVKKFDESVLNVQSQIEQYISNINNVTPRNLYNTGYGIKKSEIEKYIKIENSYFNLSKVLTNNFSILAEKATLLSEKYSAMGSNEYLTLELMTQHNIKENKLSNVRNEDNQVPGGYTYDDDNDSYIGVQVSFTGLNYAKYKNQQSEFELYKQKLIKFDEFVHSIDVDLKKFKEQYALTSARLTNIRNQVRLTTELIRTQLKELRVDESSAFDIFRNISTLSELEFNRLTTYNELLDLSSQIYNINSVIPKNYVIK